MNFSRPPPPTGAQPFPPSESSQQVSTDFKLPLPTTSSPSSSAGAPPSYAFVARVYRRTLRPIVMGFAFFAAMWSLIWGAGALYDIPDNTSLKTINIVLGTLYLTIGLIEIFGVFAAFKQTLPLVRSYAYASILAALIVTAAEAVRFSTYFTHKKDLIDNCTKESTGLTVISYGSFWGSRGTTSTLTEAEAQRYCNNSWNRSIWTSIAWLILAALIGWFLVSLAFSFHHQLLSPEQLRRPLAPSQAYAMNAYNPQPGYGYPAYGQPQQPREDYVPAYDPAKLPEYSGGYSSSGHGHDVKRADDSTEDVSTVAAAAGGNSAATARNV